MKNAKHTAALLSISAFALVLMGAGCEGFLKSDTDIMVDDDAMMEESNSGDTMMAGDAMNDDENMVGGDAMVGGEGDVMLGGKDAMMEGSMEGEAMMEEDDSMMMEQSSAGSFEAYSENKLRMADDGTVVLAFLADWCPTCRAFKSDTNAQADEIPAGLTILDVNYDNATELRQQYGVTTQHTFVEVDAEGNMIQMWRGGNTLESLVNKVS